MIKHGSSLLPLRACHDLVLIVIEVPILLVTCSRGVHTVHLVRLKHRSLSLLAMIQSKPHEASQQDAARQKRGQYLHCRGPGSGQHNHRASGTGPPLHRACSVKLATSTRKQKASFCEGCTTSAHPACYERPPAQWRTCGGVLGHKPHFWSSTALLFSLLISRVRKG